MRLMLWGIEILLHGKSNGRRDFREIWRDEEMEKNSK